MMVPAHANIIEMKSCLPVFWLFFLLVFLACRQGERKIEDAETVTTPRTAPDTLQAINEKWEGTWEREGAIDPATLQIQNISPMSFDFYLTVNDGIKTGELSGKAIYRENSAFFNSTHTTDTCQINFLFQDSLLILNQKNKGCKAGSEMDFSGEYFHESYFKEKAMEEDAMERAADTFGKKF